MKDNNRKEKGKPFEVYLNDPSAVKSPNEIRTDVYQPVE
jgi:effector-binding domain-containing protein